MAYKADPGGRFQSDAHRRVLSHLTLPDEEFGYTPKALFHRMADDVGTNFENVEAVREVLLDLTRESGFAEEPTDDVFRMTDKGLDTLTMGIVDEPEPLAEGETARPARLDEKTPLRGHAVGSSSAPGFTATKVES